MFPSNWSTYKDEGDNANGLKSPPNDAGFHS